MDKPRKVYNFEARVVSRSKIQTLPWHALERTQLVKISVREFLDDIMNTNAYYC